MKLSSLLLSRSSITLCFYNFKENLESWLGRLNTPIGGFQNVSCKIFSFGWSRMSWGTLQLPAGTMVHRIIRNRQQTLTSTIRTKLYRIVKRKYNSFHAHQWYKAAILIITSSIKLHKISFGCDYCLPSVQPLNKTCNRRITVPISRLLAAK